MANGKIIPPDIIYIILPKKFVKCAKMNLILPKKYAILAKKLHGTIFDFIMVTCRESFLQATACR
ncbi:MAG: hypothetical protein LBT48_00115 [Prevotellaceae bacterium]|nr:hypothetical protein [Prevotellaceae bacterium]